MGLQRIAIPRVRGFHSWANCKFEIKDGPSCIKSPRYFPVRITSLPHLSTPPLLEKMVAERSSSGKRRSDYSSGGGGKRRNSGDDRDRLRDGFAPDPDDTVYRYLCPGKKIGSILGRGGEIVKQLRSDTRAKIRIGETVPGCDERIITIWSSGKATNNWDETGEMVSPAQDALFKVHDKIVVDDMSGGEEGEAGMVQATARLLVPSDQIGCVIGKGGSIIQTIRSDTGAQIRVMKNEHMPTCALPTDELIQIIGDPGIVRKALTRVASQLHENPSRSNSVVTLNVPLVGPIVSPYGGYDRDHRAADWASFYPPPRDEHSAREFTMRMVCRSSLVGAVIGKSGSVINQIRQDSGATINVDSEAIEDDCIISISAREYFEDPVSPSIDAAVKLQPKCSDRTESENTDVLTTRLLVSSSRIGCLIGKGGCIVSEMRRSSRANIRILSKDKLPKVATLDDEMVQISGELDVVKNALVQVATRLKANFFERENELSHFPPILYPPVRSHSPPPRYSREGRYSSSHGIYGSSGDPDSYGRYGGSHGGGSGYGTYGGYSGRSGSNGPGSHGRYH